MRETDPDWVMHRKMEYTHTEKHGGDSSTRYFFLFRGS